MRKHGSALVARKSTVIGLTITAGALAVLAVGAHRIFPFICDDALISLRYADRLIHGHGLTWTDGERVEGYSNLLWVLACALLGALGMDLVDAARLLGLLGMGAAIAAIVYAFRPHRWRDATPAAVGALTLASAGCTAVWSIGGLEQPLVAALLAWGIATSLPLLEGGEPTWRAAWAAGICFGLLAITRPDGALFGTLAGLVLAGAGRSRGSELRPALVVFAMPLAFASAQQAFRLCYYHDFVPNTAHVKLDSSAQRWVGGAHYVLNGLNSFLPIVALAIGGAVVDLRAGARRARAILLCTLVFAWLLYVAKIGGDIFPGRRHMVPAIVILAFLAGDFACGWTRTSRWKVGVASLASLGALAVFARDQWTDFDTVRASDERWEWDCKSSASMIGRAFEREQPVVAVDPAGCFPFFSRLPAIDMLGLNDRWIATHPPPSLDSGTLAHEFGDGPYVLSRAPDMTLFCSPEGNQRACFPSGVWLDGSQEFHALYRPVLFEVRQPQPFRWWMYVRLSGRIGIRDGGDSWTIPGLFFAEDGDVVATAEPSGRIAAACAPDHPARFSALAVGAGRFAIEVRADKPIAHVAILGAGDSAIATVEGGSGSFVAPAGTEAYSIVVTPREADTLLHEVGVRRRERPEVAPPAQ